MNNILHSVPTAAEPESGSCSKSRGHVLTSCTDLRFVFSAALFRDGANGADTDAKDRSYISVLESGEGQRRAQTQGTVLKL